MRALRISLFFVVFGCISLLAQVEPIKVNEQNRTGKMPFSTSIGSDVEEVDLATGNLRVHVPLASRPGRGMDSSLVLRYDALFWTASRYVDAYGNYIYQWKTEKRGELAPNQRAQGWDINKPRITHGTRQFVCSPTTTAIYATNYIYHDPDGGKHPLAVHGSLGTACSVQDWNGPDLGGQGIWASKASATADPEIYLPDGTRVSTQGSTIWRDSNGNQKGTGTDYWIDTLGRSLVTVQVGTNQTLYRTYDSNGTLQTYTVNYGTVPVTTNFAIASPGGIGNIVEFNNSLIVVTSIVLPNGKSYVFHYNDPYGAISKIDLPTGGSISYTWTTYGDGTKTRRIVNSRTVTNNGTSATWNVSGTSIKTVTDPDGNQSVFTTAAGGAITSAKFYNGTATGTPVRQHTIDYVSDSDPWADDYVDPSDPEPYEPQIIAQRPTRITTTLDDGSVSKQEFDYETFSYSVHSRHQNPGFSTLYNYTTSRGNASEIREYAYGAGSPGALLRKTTFSYLHNANAAYKANNINIVSKVLTKTIFDGGGNQKAQTQYEYDSTALTGTAGAPQHDASYNTSFTLRGNATKAKQWRNTDGALLTSTYTYDDLGNIRSITDPSSHTTNWTYTDSWANSSCLPTGDAQAYATQLTNPLGHRIKVSHYPCTGLKQSVKDENDIIAGRLGTTFQYDLLGRATLQAFPDGGQTSTTYNDAAPASITTASRIIGTTDRVSVSVLDGLGRTAQTQLTSDPEGTVYVDTTFDAAGRMKTSSNPYRTTAEATYGTTTVTYDVLGRTKTVTTSPDGATVSNSFAGACVTATDQASKNRKSCTDALGRLTSVLEPNDSGILSHETAYQYDALDNLTRIDQKGGTSDPTLWRTRTFGYNSLSQLLTSNNPETGTVLYSYDLDGNLSTKSDARGVTVTSTYDVLHRLTGKSFSDGTPTRFYEYDQVSVWGVALSNTIGRLSHEGTWTPSSERIIGYDEMGRVTVQKDCTPTNCGSSTYGTTADYNLLGDLSWLIYPSGRKVAYGYNAAARLTSVNFESWNGSSTNYQYLAISNSHPHGPAKTGTFGNTVIESDIFNNRLQPSQITLTLPGVQTLLDKAYSYTATGVGNNGNIMQVADQLTSARTQTFTYDNVNRLKTAETPTEWGNVYTYDAWGNMTVAPKAGKNRGENFQIAGLASNRLAGYGYDNSGNLTSDGSHTYQYDAENRMKSLDTSAATYYYGPEGDRTKKIVGTSSTEYIYFGDNLLSEKTSTSDWSDFIFANGKRVARADNFNNEAHIHGRRCSACGDQWAQFSIGSGANQAGYVIQSGDKLVLRQWSATGSRGGMTIAFTDGSNTNWHVSTKDLQNQFLNDDAYQSGTIRWRTVSLTSHVGKTISNMYLVAETTTSPGLWDITYSDIALISTNGTVRPVYGRETSLSLANASISSGMTEIWSGVDHLTGRGNLPAVTTTYYHGDTVGSSRVLTSAGGYPVWETTYYPYGRELDLSTSSHHHKFSGKERDSESNLDYFGARYYGSTFGRFSSPDPIAMTAKRLSDPQQFNLYAYARNNPLLYVDPTGETIDFANSASQKRFDAYVKSLDPNSQEYATVMQLQASEVNYIVNVGGNADYDASSEGKTTTDGRNILINIKNDGDETFSMNGRFAHELEHGRQFDNGEISFLKNDKGKWTASPTTYDIGDEINAFKAQLRASPPDANKQFLPRFANAKTDEERKGVLVRVSDGYRNAARRGIGNNLNVPGKSSGELIKTTNGFGRVH